MSGTELIMGMEEVVQHIRELEKQKNQLEEENKKLKYDLYELNDIAEERGSHMEALEEERVRLESQNKQLQEEKSAMKEELEKAWDQRGDKWRKARIKTLDAENKKLQEENEENLASLNFYTEQCAELKDERKQLQEEINHKNKAFAEWCEENKKLKEENKELQEELDNEESAEGLDLVQIKKLKEEIKELKKEQLTEENAIQYVYENTDLYDDWVKGSTAYKELQEEKDLLSTAHTKTLKRRNWDASERQKLKEEILELEMKGNVRKDIIKNMFECITADTEEVQDGFYIKRDWGNKCIDKWNEIVSQEYQDALKDINEQLEGIEWVSDGYQFDLNIVDESEEDSDEEEYEEPDSP